MGNKNEKPLPRREGGKKGDGTENKVKKLCGEGDEWLKFLITI